jgi:hypothetical protein
VLVVADALASEYGWARDYILFEIPLQEAFAWYAAIAARYGNEQRGPNYEELDLLDALDAASPPASPRRRRR